MPKIEVMRPIEIKINGKNTRLMPGIREISDDAMNAWYIPGLIKAGAIKPFIKESHKPVNKMMYGNVKVTLGSGDQRVIQEIKTAPVASQVPQGETIEAKSKGLPSPSAKTRLMRS